MNERVQNLINECKRQEESCLYTSTALYEWLKSLRWMRITFVIAPIILGGLATWPLLSKQPDYQWVTGICALLAGLSPAVYKALGLDVSLSTLTKTAHQFKTLQDRFRQAWRISALSDDEAAFKAEFASLMDRMDKARAISLTAPDRFFKKAQRKIAEGHYEFGVDLSPGVHENQE